MKYIAETKKVDVNEYYRRAYPVEIAANDRYSPNKDSQPVEVFKYILILTGINKGEGIFGWAMGHCSEDMMEYLIEQAEKQGIDIPVSIVVDNSIRKRYISTLFASSDGGFFCY